MCYHGDTASSVRKARDTYHLNYTSHRDGFFSSVITTQSADCELSQTPYNRAQLSWAKV